MERAIWGCMYPIQNCNNCNHRGESPLLTSIWISSSRIFLDPHPPYCTSHPRQPTFYVLTNSEPQNLSMTGICKKCDIGNTITITYEPIPTRSIAQVVLHHIEGSLSFSAEIFDLAFRKILEAMRGPVCPVLPFRLHVDEHKSVFYIK